MTDLVLKTLLKTSWKFQQQPVYNNSTINSNAPHGRRIHPVVKFAKMLILQRDLSKVKLLGDFVAVFRRLVKVAHNLA
jgi:hypothetical protein